MENKQGVARTSHAMTILFWLAFLAFFAYSFQSIMDFDAIAHPRRQEAFVRILTALSKPDLSNRENTREVVVEMWETFQIGFLATAISAFFASILSFFSARPSTFWGRGFSILLQPILSAIRAIHPLIVTMPAILLAGIGPTAGVLALTLFSTSVLAGSFTEFAQHYDSLGWRILFKRYFPGLVLKHLPVNILIATILGFWGGGGIGFLLQTHINLLNYRDAGVALLACIIVIGSLDLLGRVVWYKIQSNGPALRSTPEIGSLP